jgi:transposase InsO family protein
LKITLAASRRERVGSTYTIAGWVDWYNHRRVHGSLGMVPPAEFEQGHYAALNPEVQPV